MNWMWCADYRRCWGAAWTFCLATLFLTFAPLVLAGGSGLNVLLVVNQASSNSLEVANYYRAKRQVPPDNVLRVFWTGTNTQWTAQEFTNTLLNPVLAYVSQNSLSNQIYIIVLSMDLPYRITGPQENSTTAALYYGLKATSEESEVHNSYAFSEGRFASEKPDTAPTNAFLTMMLTADSLETALQTIDQGVSSDSSFPTQTVWLIKSSDPNRNIRYKRFDDAIFNARLCPGYSLSRTNLYSGTTCTNILGCQLGLMSFSLPPNTFVPGAIADNMTSFSGQIFETNHTQTTLLELIDAGASASYGTVTEPSGSPVSFPDPMVYFHQSRGYGLAESYYQAVEQPYEGLFVGEPLAAPWSRTFQGGWTGVSASAVLRGQTNLCLTFTADQIGRPLERIDLFVDGRYLQTCTNVLPQAGNRLTVNLNGYGVSYTVPPGASLATVASGLAATLNASATTNITKVTARAIGDRIELQSFGIPLPNGMFQVIDDTVTPPATNVYLAAPSSRVIASSGCTTGQTGDGNFHVHFDSPAGISNLLQASTNFADWVTLFTNQSGGPFDFLDKDARLYPMRYYRTVFPQLTPTPHLTALGLSPANDFILRVTSPTNRPYVLQASSDRLHWKDIATNSNVGDHEFTDAYEATAQQRYYRTRSGDTNDYSSVTIVGQTPSEANILHVGDSGLGETIVWSSTNGTDWVPIYTYGGTPSLQIEAGSAPSAGEPLSTYLTAAHSNFLDSIAYGIRSLTVVDGFPANGTIPPGEYLRLSVGKTNDTLVTVSITNTTPNATLSNFVYQFVAAVNARPELQQPDGLVLEDLAAGPFQWSRSFNARALNPGIAAAGIQVSLQSSAGMTIIPSGTAALDENRTDLLPRNHLYVSDGVHELSQCFSIDTTKMPDGFHELTAVAYEGTHVYSQTLRSVPVIVSNSPLQATLTLQTASLTNGVNTSFNLMATANTNSVAQILLFTTGGFYAGKTNQQNATFTVNGLDLGVGEHPFHALITTSNGQKYRTATVNVTLTR